MPKYANYDSTQPSPSPVFGWYDTDFANYPNLPDAANLLELSDADWKLHLTQGAPEYAVDSGSLVPYTPPPPVLSLSQQAARMLGQGCIIESVSIPALNRTYAVDAASRATIAEVVAGINGGDGFPKGNPTYNYTDSFGTTVFPSTASFMTVARALRDWLYDVYEVINGRSDTLPSQTVQIA